MVIVHTTSFPSQRLIELSVRSHENVRGLVYVCVRGIDFVCVATSFALYFEIFRQCFSHILEISFIGGRNRNTCQKSPTLTLINLHKII